MTRATRTGNAAGDYRQAAADLDTHMTSCPDCRSGRGCETGDDTAEAEFRAFRSWQRDDPDTARTAQRERP